MSESLPLEGKHLLITSGPTRGNIDAVRYISNRSSGKLGAMIADEAIRNGARVTFVHGWGSHIPQEAGNGRCRLVRIETVDDVMHAVESVLTKDRADVVIHLMAVLDYVPAEPRTTKTPSGRGEWNVRLIKTPKAIKLIRRLAPHAYLVSFKLEVNKPLDELVQIAYNSLQRNESQLVVANDLSQIEDGRHQAYFIDPSGKIDATCETKHEIATKLIEHVCRALTKHE